MAAAILLTKNGAKVFLSDSSDKKKLLYLDEQKLDQLNIEFEIGGHTEKIYDCTFIVISPGIKPDSDIIKKARSLNIKIISEIEAASWFCKAPIAGITGTNGKTTTTVLTGEIFKNSARRTEVCGNVGTAFSEVVEELEQDSIAVLELSSFQLDNIIDLKPAAAAILNISEDHIDWHGSFENYINAKFKINMNQGDEDLFILNADDEEIMKHSKKSNGIKAGITLSTSMEKSVFERGCYIKDNGIIYFDKGSEEEIIHRDKINIKGDHNIYNSMAGITIAKHFGVDNDVIRKTLTEFGGVEHRIEFAGTFNGVTYYNDSKATNLDSLKVALKTFKSIVLMLGGKSSGNDYDTIKDLLKGRVRKIIALGEDKDNIFNSLNEAVEVEIADSFENSVRMAKDSAVSGDTVLFSPACKSFDMFTNYEERGNKFKKIVNELNA